MRANRNRWVLTGLVFTGVAAGLGSPYRNLLLHDFGLGLAVSVLVLCGLIWGRRRPLNLAVQSVLYGLCAQGGWLTADPFSVAFGGLSLWCTFDFLRAIRGSQ